MIYNYAECNLSNVKHIYIYIYIYAHRKYQKNILNHLLLIYDFLNFFKMYDETIFLSDTETQRQREQSKNCAPDRLDNSVGHKGECQPLTSSHWILRLLALALPTLPATRCHQEGEQCQATLCSLEAYLPPILSAHYSNIPNVLVLCFGHLFISRAKHSS